MEDKESGNPNPCNIENNFHSTPPKINRRQDLPGRCWTRPTRLQRTGSRAQVRKTPATTAPTRLQTRNPHDLCRCGANCLCDGNSLAPAPQGPSRQESPPLSPKSLNWSRLSKPALARRRHTSREFCKTEKTVPRPGRTGPEAALEAPQVPCFGAGGRSKHGMRTERARIQPPPNPQSTTPSSDKSPAWGTRAAHTRRHTHAGRHTNSGIKENSGPRFGENLEKERYLSSRAPYTRHQGCCGPCPEPGNL